MMKLDFNTKESYLVSVELWKAEYKEIANEISELRKELSKPHVGWKTSIAQSRKVQLRQKAREMLQVRLDGKALSRQLKQMEQTES